MSQTNELKAELTQLVVHATGCDEATAREELIAEEWNATEAARNIKGMQAQIADLQNRLSLTTHALNLSTELVLLANKQRDEALAQLQASATAPALPGGWTYAENKMGGLKLQLHGHFDGDGDLDDWHIYAGGVEVTEMYDDEKSSIWKSAEKALLAADEAADAEAKAEAAVELAQWNLSQLRRAA